MSQVYCPSASPRKATGTTTRSTVGRWEMPEVDMSAQAANPNASRAWPKGNALSAAKTYRS